ncbi:hypothetical protein [Streptomyces nitrosporeus]|uniref:hypothetical protein n=1 Tax=Streptomyces nitrosporeus TaxID=28894 RepID=UPI00399EF000
MTVHFEPIGGILLVIACLVGAFVYKHSKDTFGTGKGDAASAVAAAAAVLAGLILIFGGANKTSEASPTETANTPGDCCMIG